MLIVLITTSGFLSDGFQIADIYYFVALILWLYLPECDRIESHIFKKINTIKKGNKKNVIQKSN